jgi:hypothetical protein
MICIFTHHSVTSAPIDQTLTKTRTQGSGGSGSSGSGGGGGGSVDSQVHVTRVSCPVPFQSTHGHSSYANTVVRFRLFVDTAFEDGAGEASVAKRAAGGVPSEDNDYRFGE